MTLFEDPVSVDPQLSAFRRDRPDQAYVRSVSVAENPRDSSHLTVVTPKEALQRSLPLPSDDDMAIECLTDEEWDAFERALADR